MSLQLTRRDAYAGDMTDSTSVSNPDNSHSAPLRRPDNRPEPVRSDVGTIVLHWSLATAIIVSLLTGLRLSADAEGSIFARALEPILPQGEIWTWHFVSALVVVAGIFAYAIYMRMSRLKRRVAMRKAVVLTLPASPKLRWGALNVVFYWILFAAILTLAATGVLLYMGYGGPVVTVHYISALVVGGYIVAHVFTHYMYGGVQQLLRLFRPQALRRFPGMARRPLAISAGVGLAVAGVAAYADFGTRDVLRVPVVAAPPVLDGTLSDAVWAEATPVSVRTQQGVHLGGSGTSTVEIRAVRDAENIYFAFQWEDPTRSLKRLPLIKRADGWHLLHNKADVADETAFYEDKFAVLFSKSDGFGNGGTTHMGPKPLVGKPGPLNGRGLHYTTDGSLADVWQWKASRGGMLGRVDDMWFGTPVEPNEKQLSGTGRYSAGYAPDEGTAFYHYNFKTEAPGGYRGPVKVARLPADLEATQALMGPVDLNPGAIDGKGAHWWMTESESVPYSPELDATIPVGTVIPGLVIMGEYSGSRADLEGGSQWNDGLWTLEVKRKLKTGHAQDLDMESGLFMWVSVFDNNQTRHTRHVRPVRLEIE